MATKEEAQKKAREEFLKKEVRALLSRKRMTDSEKNYLMMLLDELNPQLSLFEAR